MDGRKRLSGFQYKKQAEAKRQKEEDDVRKSMKIDSFFKSKASPSIASASTSQNDNNDQPIGEGENIRPEVEMPVTPVTAVTAINVQHEQNTDVIRMDSEDESSINLNDPATWILERRTDKETIINQIVSKQFSLDSLKNENFEKSERVYKIGGDKTKSRYLNESLFYSKLPNGEITIRDWLRYSSSTGKVFCVPCTLFGKDVSLNLVSGFNDWKNAYSLFGEHERGQFHRKNTIIYVDRRNKQMSIDRELTTQYEQEKAYWRLLVHRIIDVVKFLSSRGLPFRGNDSQLGSVHNGLYLGTLELLAKYDDFLQQHLKKYGNKGKGNVSYLSSTICDEIIALMGKKTCDAVINEINQSKYYSIIVDSTPDCAHIDQLTIVFRFVTSEGVPVERFYTFVAIESHTAVSLEETIFKILEVEDTGLEIKFCRGQCYDNANNMSGVYGGLQTLIKRHNKLAHFIPCSGHSLNLVGSAAVESCSAANKYFLFLQHLYNFFSASTKRWSLLMKHLDKYNQEHQTNEKLNVVKDLSDTRWSARYDASNALKKGYNLIVQCLDDISNDSLNNEITRVEAKSLHKQLGKNETAFMINFWTAILQRNEHVNKNLQSPSLTLDTCIDLYKSLEAYFQEMRKTRFQEFFDETVKLTGEKWPSVEEQTNEKRVRKKKLHFDEATTHTVFNYKEKLEYENYNSVLDVLIAELSRRRESYSMIHELFDFLIHIENTDDEKIKTDARNLIAMYVEDLNDDMVNECLHYKEYVKESKKKLDTAAEKFKDLCQNDLMLAFPNVFIALKMYVCMPISNASGERSFSSLKRVKNYLRSTLGQEKLGHLSVLHIESQIANDLDWEELCDDFASAKARKKNF